MFRRSFFPFFAITPHPSCIPLFQPQEHGEGRPLGYQNHGADRRHRSMVIQRPHHCAAAEQAQAVDRIKYTVSRSPLVKGRQVGNGRAHDGLMGPQYDAVQDKARHRPAGTMPQRQEGHRRRHRRNKCQGQQPRPAIARALLDPVVNAANDQRHHCIHHHLPQHTMQ